MVSGPNSSNAKHRSGWCATTWSMRSNLASRAGSLDSFHVFVRWNVTSMLASNDVTFQRTKTWKESNDPARDAKLDRIDHVVAHHPERCFAFDEFGPLTIRPLGGNAWAQANAPQRQPANYHKLQGVRQF